MMSGLAFKLVSLLLALGVAGTVMVCPCLAPPAKAAVGAAIPGCHRCKKSEQSIPKQPSKCQECKVTASVEKASGIDVAPLMPLMWEPVPGLGAMALLEDGVAGVEKSLPPPLLRDLFHSSCLLTV
jgi:hypothetical protein